MQIINRADAAVQGLTHFYTGRLCQQGHDAKRYVSTGTCIACSKGYVDKFRHTFLDTRPGVCVVRGLVVPKKHVRAIVEMAQAFMAAEGLLAGPPPTVTEPPRSMTPSEAADAAARIAGLPPSGGAA